MADIATGAALARLHGAVAAGSADRVAAELVALFQHIEPLADKVQWVDRQLAADLHGDAALTRACAAVAAAIDAEPATFDRHGYHNRQHFCEVALTAYALCRLNRLATQTTQFVLLAALVHDVVHEGRPQATFVQERASVNRVRPLLLAAGVTPAQVDRLMAMVLATDPAGGTAFMSACCHGAPPAPPADAPELAALAHDAQLAELARLLCEADVLPSIGLDLAHGMRLQDRLAREWQRPLHAQDKLAFIDSVLQQGYIGPFFLPSVHATRAAALAALLHAVAEG